MTKFFIQNFKRTNKCSVCPKDNVSGYHMCAAHLERARVHWQKWAYERRSIGKCIACDRAGRKATRAHHSRGEGDLEQRCWLHAKLNTEKMRKWVAAHPDAAREAYKLSLKLRDAGLCPKCPEHRKLPTGFSRCEPCRIKDRVRKAGK